jgi:hypothetical protein
MICKYSSPCQILDSDCERINITRLHEWVVSDEASKFKPLTPEQWLEMYPAYDEVTNEHGIYVRWSTAMRYALHLLPDLGVELVYDTFGLLEPNPDKYPYAPEALTEAAYYLIISKMPGVNAASHPGVKLAEVPGVRRRMYVRESAPAGLFPNYCLTKAHEPRPKAEHAIGRPA